MRGRVLSFHPCMTCLPLADPKAWCAQSGPYCLLLLHDGYDAIVATLSKWGSVQVTDGAAAVLMMTRREAVRRQLPILGIFRSFAAVGVDPAIMGVGPAVAIPEAVKQAGLAIDDIDLFELNEAFASQV